MSVSGTHTDSSAASSAASSAGSGSSSVAGVSPEVLRLSVDTLRTLAMDAVQAANSGHPGTPMALAPLVYALYTRHLRHDPRNPDWPDRDRFILSVGHASMVLYGALHLSGYDLPLDEIRHFRQWGSLTPGHPEYHHTKGVETTTGPLGQGVANSVGFAVAEAHMAASFNRDGHEIVDHYTYFIAGDGCLMEGISHEAASFAGHQKLGKLIGFFDDNGITIDGHTSLSCGDDAAMRFEAYGWQVLHIADVNDQSAIDSAIAQAKADTERPSLIITTTHIGYGSPNRQDSSKAHGEPLGAEEILLTKKAYGWPSVEPFFIPDSALENWRFRAAERARSHAEWNTKWEAYQRAFPDLAAEFTRRMAGTLPAELDSSFPDFDAKTGNVASRAASGAVINAIAGVLPELFGGSADLSGSNLTTIKSSGHFSAEDRLSRNVAFGIREHGMGGILNGMCLHGGVIPYGGTFLVFTDYMRPAIRLAALMGIRVIYVFTHDSIGLGEDGPTHQPIEHLSALRAIPNLLVLRPADADEVSEAWRVALHHKTGPSALVLTRQKLAYMDAAQRAREGVPHGAYVVADAPDGKAASVVLLASGSEVELALVAHEQLQADGISSRVLSCPSLELFAAQPQEYRDRILPPGTPRVAVEASQPMSWYRWVGDNGTVVGIEHFGASAPYKTVYEKFGITAEHVAREARKLVSAAF